MATTFKRSVARGFTLIELLIVVIILAILAAIAIPQFSSSTSDAQSAALDTNLAVVRTAIEQYKLQHAGFSYPGAKISTGATCPDNGEAKGGAAGTEAALMAQLQFYSNAEGLACTTKNDTFRFGPYLRQGIPAEPFSNEKTVKVVTTNTVTGVADGKGWAYSSASGQFISNNSSNDSSGTAYSSR